MAKIQLNPDCRDGKHQSCSGDGWDLDEDLPANCPCPCHRECFTPKEKTDGS